MDLGNLVFPRFNDYYREDMCECVRVSGKWSMNYGEQEC